MVRLPASVLAMASPSQAICGLLNPGTSDFSSITAGTLLTMLLKQGHHGVKTRKR